MSKRRVVVTGLGAVTPVGNNVQAFWESVKTGKIGIGEITRFDTADFKVKLAAEVKILMQKIIWISNLPNVWNFSASMQ